MTAKQKTLQIGVVIIGRNEGKRLRRCLESVDHEATVVYVDSQSSDDSVALARGRGVVVVELDMSKPFSAARARNEGFRALMRTAPETRYVQFADGDCELIPGWTEQAVAALEQDPSLGVVAGRRRERDPGFSIYNRLCEMEWNTPVGDAKACGGDAMMRVEAFQQIDGFNAAVIAGEEPELCVRLRAAGWRIRRIEADMTLHDAAMSSFKQWWRRMQRSGHAYAQGAAMHGAAPERHWVREVKSICFWAGVIPIITLLTAWPTSGLSLMITLGYLLPISRAAQYYRRRGFSASDSRLTATFDVLAKFPQLAGVLLFYFNQLRSKQTTLIEYKGATT